MKIKNNQLLITNSILSNLSFPTNITVESITGLVSLTAKITLLLDSFKKSTDLLMKSYGIEADPTTTGYSWIDNEKSEEITSKFTELSSLVNDVDITISEPNLFAKIGKGLHIQQVLILKDILES